MKTPRLLSTNNYTLFSHNPEQQPISVDHVKKLVASIKKHGFRPSKPLQAYQGKKGLVLVDGHHRLEAARLAGSWVYYVVEELATDPQGAMADENTFVRKWPLMAFVRMFAGRGLHDYIVLRDYVSRGVPLSRAASLLIGQSASSGNANELIPTGRFRVKDTKRIDQVVSLIESEPENATLRHGNFIAALSLCLWLKEFDFPTFTERLKTNARMLPKCSNKDDFLRSIEEIYNFRTRVRVPIAFLSTEAAKARSKKA